MCFAKIEVLTWHLPKWKRNRSPNIRPRTITRISERRGGVWVWLQRPLGRLGAVLCVASCSGWSCVLVEDQVSAPRTICEEAQALNALYCGSSKFIMLMYGPGPTRPPVSASSALLCSPVAAQRTDCMCVTVDLMCDIITGAFDRVSW